MACGILVLRAGIKPTSLALEMWCFNHWTTREVHICVCVCVCVCVLATHTAFGKLVES